MSKSGTFRAGEWADRIEFEVALARIAAHCGPQNRGHVDTLCDRALALAAEMQISAAMAMRQIEAELYEGQLAAGR